MPKERNKADSYRERAYAGDTRAMNNLGVCYERGTGVKVSLELAFEWYMKAAELGDTARGWSRMPCWPSSGTCGPPTRATCSRR